MVPGHSLGALADLITCQPEWKAILPQWASLALCVSGDPNASIQGHCLTFSELSYKTHSTQLDQSPWVISGGNQPYQTGGRKAHWLEWSWARYRIQAEVKRLRFRPGDPGFTVAGSPHRVPGTIPSGWLNVFSPTHFWFLEGLPSHEKEVCCSGLGDLVFKGWEIVLSLWQPYQTPRKVEKNVWENRNLLQWHLVLSNCRSLWFSRLNPALYPAECVTLCFLVNLIYM